MPQDSTVVQKSPLHACITTHSFRRLVTSCELGPVLHSSVFGLPSRGSASFLLTSRGSCTGSGGDDDYEEYEDAEEVLPVDSSDDEEDSGQPISDDSSRPMYTEEQLAGESSGSEAHSEPSADSSSAPSALDLRKDELIQANLRLRKGDLAEGQAVAEVRKAVETDLGIETKGEEFELIRQMEKEVGSSKKEQCPATNSIFNEIKDHLGKHLDGLGGGHPKSKDER